MATFRATTTVEIEIEIEATTLADAQVIADSIEINVALSLSAPYQNSRFRNFIPQVWVSTDEMCPDWSIVKD